MTIPNSPSKRTCKPKLAKYRPQLTKPEIDIIINCLSATLVSGYNNPGLPAVIKKFKLLAHKIDLDAIGASYEVASPAKRSGFEPNAVNSLANPDAMQAAKQKVFLHNDTPEAVELAETLANAQPGDIIEVQDIENIPELQELQELQLTEQYCWDKYQALGGDAEAMQALDEEEQALLSMYKANERMELTEEDNTRISAYMIKQLSRG